VTKLAGLTFAFIGSLAAFPRRLAAREVERQGGELLRGITRRTTNIVLGRAWLRKASEREIRAQFDLAAKSGRLVLSENGFLRLLGVMEAQSTSGLSRQAVLDQSKLPEGDFELLCLLDAFEHDREPFSFRDVILARKYAGLIAGGATWHTIARSVRRSGKVASLTALSLQAVDDKTIHAISGNQRSELDGQGILPLRHAEDAEIDRLFEIAAHAEEDGRHLEAAGLYERCAAMDPCDAIAPFNLGNCLHAAGLADKALAAHFTAIKRDSKFVEAWFNAGVIFQEQGNAKSARRYLERAIKLDGNYADPIFNLANLEFETGNLSDARRWWARYLQLDGTSDWARTAARGIQYADLHLNQKTAS
jgi:tetratricopeptide (TPR) repeat protein